MLTSCDFSLIAVVCAEAVPDPAFVSAGRDLEELQRYQHTREGVWQPREPACVERSLYALSQVLAGNPLIHLFF